MSLEQTMTYLYDHNQILHHITATIWDHLQRKSPNFFNEYNKRCELARQIAKFNDLLAQQKDLIDLSTSTPVTKLQKPNDHHDDQDQVHDHWFESDDFADIEDAFPSLIDPVAAPVTNLQKPNDQDQICDQWINGSNDLASFIDLSLFAETPQSDPPTTAYAVVVSSLVTQACDPSGDNKGDGTLGRSHWAGFGLCFLLACPFLRRRPREAGFTEQRPPSSLDGGRITGRCLPSPL
ncbi:unnamed protein product [Arabidopsis halleri]